METRRTSVGLRGNLEKSNCANVDMQSLGMGRTRVLNDNHGKLSCSTQVKIPKSNTMIWPSDEHKTL